ncbi:helix-turn-helix domain-containing protein [Paenibacillus rigui]|uniref:helix-turn-helix domain-containing protein n=1 Tax=Paenibacillus rigui TaxID=554312 RepID=UPI001FE440D4|nr:helix-turn-helix transcriptional regulator [Paenibacillus rigui]
MTVGQPIPDFGKFLESLRGSMSLREAAKKSGLSHAYIRDLELERNRSTNEKITPSPDTLQKLSLAYDYSYTDLMIKAGHLAEEQTFTETASDTSSIDLSAIHYIQIGMKDILYCNQEQRVTRNINSLKDFSRFLDLLDERDYKKIDTDLYVNFQHIRKYDERGGKLYFDVEGTGPALTLSALRQRKYHELILRTIAKNNQTCLEYSFGTVGSGTAAVVPSE